MVKNQIVEDYFDRLLEKGPIPGQTFAFFGEVDALNFCHALAHRLIESTRPDHPDLVLFKPQGKQALHTIQEMRRLSDEAKRRPHLAPYVVIIVEEADRMMPTSSNALLKTFEEPHPQCLIFLTTSKPERLLPTLLSRCTKLNFPKASSNDTPHHVTLALDLLNSMPDTIFALKERIQQIVKAIEEKSDKKIKAPSDLTAHQKEHFEKSQEGADSLFVQQESQRVLLALLTQVGEEALPLFEKAHAALERQLPLQHALESLYIQLSAYPHALLHASGD